MFMFLLILIENIWNFFSGKLLNKWILSLLVVSKSNVIHTEQEDIVIFAPPLPVLCSSQMDLPSSLLRDTMSLLNLSSVWFPSGFDVWYLLHVQGEVSGQNSSLNHLQSGLVLIQREAAQDLVSLGRERNVLFHDLHSCKTNMKVGQW